MRKVGTSKVKKIDHEGEAEIKKTENRKKKTETLSKRHRHEKDEKKKYNDVHLTMSLYAE
jgi:hypothetical protein